MDAWPPDNRRSRSTKTEESKRNPAYRATTTTTWASVDRIWAGKSYESLNSICLFILGRQGLCKYARSLSWTETPPTQMNCSPRLDCSRQKRTAKTLKATRNGWQNVIKFGSSGGLVLQNFPNKCNLQIRDNTWIMNVQGCFLYKIDEQTLDYPDGTTGPSEGSPNVDWATHCSGISIQTFSIDALHSSPWDHNDCLPKRANGDLNNLME